MSCTCPLRETTAVANSVKCGGKINVCYREIAPGGISHFKEFHCVFSFRPWKHKYNYIYHDFNIHNIAFSTPSPPQLDFCMIIKNSIEQKPQVDQGILTVQASRSQSDTSQSVRLLRTGDQPNARTSTWQHTTLTRDRHPWPRRDSNPLS